MPLLNYTTTIVADKTATEIVGTLARKHARNILMDYDGHANVKEISVEGLLAGRPSGESQASLIRWLQSRAPQR